MEQLTVEFDGGSRGNPGPAGLGAVVRAADGTPLVTLGRFIGRATNNVAEYKGLIAGLEKALELGATNVLVCGDSELIIRQMNGQYRVRHPAMLPLYERAQELARQFKSIRFQHNLRHKNQLADKLVNLAIDRKGEVSDVDEPPAANAQPTTSPAGAVAGDRFVCPRCGCAIEIRRPSTLPPAQLRPFLCQCGTRLGRE